MPIVEIKEIIHRDIFSIWSRVCDVESYPEFMESVLAVEKLGITGNSTLVRWEVRLKESILKWTELETCSADRHRIDFMQVDGDLERFCGYWQLSEIASDRTEATLYIDFEIGVPMLREMLNPVAERALRDNSRSMLRSLELALTNDARRPRINTTATPDRVAEKRSEEHRANR